MLGLAVWHHILNVVLLAACLVTFALFFRRLKPIFLLLLGFLIGAAPLIGYIAQGPQEYVHSALSVAAHRSTSDLFHNLDAIPGALNLFHSESGGPFLTGLQVTPFLIIASGLFIAVVCQDRPLQYLGFFALLSLIGWMLFPGAYGAHHVLMITTIAIPTAYLGWRSLKVRKLPLYLAATAFVAGQAFSCLLYANAIANRVPFAFNSYFRRDVINIGQYIESQLDVHPERQFYAGFWLGSPILQFLLPPRLFNNIHFFPWFEQEIVSTGKISESSFQQLASLSAGAVVIKCNSLDPVELRKLGFQEEFRDHFMCIYRRMNL
jgi:hypothetical protein